MGAVDFVDDSFGGSIGMIAEAASERCANGDCFNQSAMMAANVVANVLEDLDVTDRQRDVEGALDNNFYSNNSAVDIADEIANDGADTFDVND